jgi:hypothetical protein
MRRKASQAARLIGSPQNIAETITLGSSCDFARHVGHAGRFVFVGVFIRVIRGFLIPWFR